MNKKSKVYSILHETCPRCHEGKVFKYTNPYQSRSFGKLNERCATCGQSFEPEPGFFQGAMYVSYAFSLGLCFTVGILMTLVFNSPVWLIVLLMTTVLLALLPPLFRISRMVWLNMFVDYQPWADTKPAEPHS